MKKKFRNRIISAFLAAAMGMSSFSGLAVTAYAAEDTGTNSNGLTLSNIDLDEDESNNDVASGNQGSDTTSSNAGDETGKTPNQSSIVDDGIATADEAPDVDADSNVSSEDNTANSVTSDSSEEEVADEDTQLSENVKAFLHAVEQCDFDAAVAKTNAYYLAQKKQQSDWYNEELIQQSQKAEEEMYAAVSLVDEADELYYNLTEDECQIQSVIDARTKLDDCYIRMDNAMKNPVEDGNKKGEGYSGEVTPEDIWLYLGEGRIPDKPTGYYIGENGLPVMTGNTKISISEYTDGGESEDLRMERAPLDEDNLSVASRKVENEDYSITKILAQVEYPENNSFAKITLGDNAKLIDAIYVGDESLRYMDEDAQKSVLLKDFHNSSAWYITYYVVSQDDFDATITYTNSTGVSTSKTMHVDVDDENVMTQDELNSLVGYDLKTSNIAEANSDSRLATTGSLLGRAILFWTGAPPVGGTVSSEWNDGIWDSFLAAGGSVIALFCLNQGRNVKGLYTYLKDFAANLAPYFGADYHTISGAFWSGAITLYDLASVRDVNDYDSSSLADFAKAYEGGICPKCGKKTIRISRGIEVGNIFQLGDKYTKAMKMTYVDQNGESKTPIMGCYGIGVGRLAAAVCEAHHDEYGPIWPKSIAPWQVHLCAVRADNEEVRKFADDLYEKLQEMGIEVIYDDRTVSAGVMFSDADLLGIPLRVIVSPRNMKQGVVEVASRDKTLQTQVKMEEAAEQVKKYL